MSEQEETFPQKRVLTCPKCKGTAFEFTWEIESKEAKFSMFWCHDGMGFELESATAKCVRCGNIGDGWDNNPTVELITNTKPQKSNGEQT